jgi:HAD superfamily hydrolase (TIGR01484 family)
MRYHALACDYDGTLAHEGTVPQETLARLERLLATGRKLILVTGRELDDLLGVFPEIEMFHRVVAENGALLYNPAKREEKPLAEAIPESFSQALRARGVEQFSRGRVILSTQRPKELAVLAAIRDQGLELQTIFNRDAVMIVPAGVNKATGLSAALEALGLSAHEVVGIGDAENDHAFLNLCEFSVAVANALPALKERADWVTRSENGTGTGELIEALIDDDLQSREAGVTRHNLLLGWRIDGSPVNLSPRGPNLLISGPSGSGKSTAATSFLERLSDAQYQFCIIDPEGDYEGLPGVVTLGRTGRGPLAEEVVEVLAKPRQSVVVNLIGLPVTERPPFFLELLPRLQDLRAHTGRPHWLILDEAHHLLPASWEPGQTVTLGGLERTALITVHPDQVLPAALRSVGMILAVGKDPQQTFELCAQPLEHSPPSLEAAEPETEMAALWSLSQAGEAYYVRIAPSRIERQRHVRKYAMGELPPDRSFYFRGPDGKLNLRAQNLHIFLQLAEGLDAETWLHHLRQGDYSQWFRSYIKDDQLAADAEAVEGQPDLSADESREQIREIVHRYYVPSASPPLPIPGTDVAPARTG